MSNPRRTVNSDNAPDPVGPYSHAVATGELLFCSGQVGLDPQTGQLVGGSVADEAAQALRNLAAVCEPAGASLERAVRLTIYTTVMEQFAEINEAYAAFFDGEPPARAVVGVAELPLGALVEIDAIVALGSD
jgi:2-iminobutanoate/2-iminopropanoate deaminase